MVTLKDIATRVGVDTSTVSKVLQGAPIRVSEAKRSEIMRIAQEMHYQPNAAARGLRLRRSGAIAMVVPTMTNYLYPEIIGGAEDAADENGYVLFLVKQSRTDPWGQLTSVVGQGRVDGLLFADEIPEPDFFERLTEFGIPFVSLNRVAPGKGPYVVLDDQAGFAAQASYLVELGHRQIAFVAVRPHSYLAQLCQGYFLDRLEQTGIPRREVALVQCDFAGDGCEATADEILALRPRPTAVATASVIVASRLVDVLRTRGVSVPDDISVIGYHDSPVGTWPNPSVSTIKMPSRRQGHQGIIRLLQVIGGEKIAAETMEEKPEILERGTCRPHRATS